MSGEVVTWAFKQMTGSPAAKLVLVKLAEHANGFGLAWPGIAMIAEDAELGISTVYKHLATLEALGLMQEVVTTHPKHGHEIDAYQLFSPGWNTEIPPRRKSKKSIPPGGTEIPRGGNPIPLDGKTIPPGGMHIEEPSLEPPVEPSAEPSGTAVAVLEGPSDLELAIQAFNEGADQCPKWTHCRQMTAQRKKTIDARLKEGGLAGWRRAVELAAASGFLGGPVPTSGDHRNWRLDIAWFAKAENFAKIHEGKYPPPGKASDRGLDSAFAGIGDFFDART